jgi:hypothetical protein
MAGGMTGIGSLESRSNGMNHPHCTSQLPLRPSVQLFDHLAFILSEVVHFAILKARSAF